MENSRLLVCDMAGTTVEDNGRVAQCFQQALGEFGVDTNYAEIQKLMGRGKLATITALLGEEKAPTCFSRFRTILEDSYQTKPAQPLKGAEELLHWAKNRGYFVSLNTGFYREVTETILQTLQWREHGLVDSVFCDDDVSQGRPAPYMIFRSMEAHGIHDIRNVVYVGDTVSDMASGRNARVKMTVGLTAGGEEPVRLYRAGASAVVPSLSVLIKLLPW